MCALCNIQCYNVSVIQEFTLFSTDLGFLLGGGAGAWGVSGKLKFLVVIITCCSECSKSNALCFGLS